MEAWIEEVLTTRNRFPAVGARDGVMNGNWRRSLNLCGHGDERKADQRRDAEAGEPRARRIRRERGSSRARCCSTAGGRRGRSKAAGLAGTNPARLQVVVEVGNGRGDGEVLSDEAGPGPVVGASMAAPGYLRQRRKDRA